MTSTDQSTTPKTQGEKSSLIGAPEEEEVWTVGRFRKNLISISIVYFLLFTSYNGLSSLQSSLHLDEGMGVISQSVVYATMALSCLLLPKLVISTIGHKWTITLSMIGYIMWMAANAYAVWGTMIPASVLVGLCAGPLWTAKSAYITEMSVHYADLTGQSTTTVAGRFFGIFFMIFQVSKIVGSFISSTILSPSPRNETGITDDSLAFCGARDCQWNNASNINYEKQPYYLVWLLVGVFLSIGVASLTIHIVFVDQLPKNWFGSPSGSTHRTVLQSLGATLALLRGKNMVMLVPISTYMGLRAALGTADYNKSFVTCVLGIWMIGYTNIARGIVESLVSIFGGWSLKFTGRVPLFSIGMAIDLSFMIFISLWQPQPTQVFMFFILPIVWGISSGLWRPQLNAFYGTLFEDEKEAAFSNYKLWESIGAAIALGYSSTLCMSTKIYISLGLLVSGMILYYYIEGCLYYSTKNVSSHDNDSRQEESRREKAESGNARPVSGSSS